MERKGRRPHIILTVAMGALLSGCGGQYDTEPVAEGARESVEIVLNCGETGTRASMPEEERISDVNLIIFENGMNDTAVWKNGLDAEGEARFGISLVKGRTYTVFALANYGKRLELSSMEELDDIMVELEESDGYGRGIPMSALEENIMADDDGVIRIGLVRMTAKISLMIDRSRLSEDVSMTVRHVRIGNCPRNVSVIGPSKVVSAYDRFETGFELTPEQCSPLNDTGPRGLSGEVSAYMLENMQGDFPGIIGEDEEKVLDEDDPLADICSYMELDIYYSSSELISYDRNLTYRFYLGEGLTDMNMERNCHYHITVTPEDDGLSGNGWRVDKSGIGPKVPTFKMMPGEYVEGHVGDTVRIWCECYPRTSPFDPGYEELNYDKSRGIYDYSVDEDGHGVTLYLKRPGTGLVYMSAGEPINRSGMVLVSVKP